MVLIDTHCHIHSRDYPLPAEEALQRAREAGVTKLICVGTDENDSADAVAFAAHHEDGVFASIGLHPHDAINGVRGIEKLKNLASQDKVVAVGECGLDYYYRHSPREQQIDMLHAQLQLARDHDLPLIFHVREAFDDFWPIFQQYAGIRGVLHSFTDSRANMERALSEGLFIGVNGISTFTKDPAQRAMFAAIPLNHLVLETDAPFLTPVPLRGKVNEPAFIAHVARFHADLRAIPLEELSAATSQNATTLFNLN